MNHHEKVHPSNSSSSDSGDTEYTGIYPALSFWLGVVSFALFGIGIFVGTYMQCKAMAKRRRPADKSQVVLVWVLMKTATNTAIRPYTFVERRSSHR